MDATYKYIKVRLHDKKIGNIIYCRFRPDIRYGKNITSRYPTNIIFYKRQLWLYNIRIYSGEKDHRYCYVWLEGQLGRGAQ